MGVLGAIVLPQPLVMRASQAKVPERRSIGAELVGSQRLRRETLFSEQLAPGADAMASAKDTVLDRAREQTQEIAGDAMERTRATVRNLREQARAAMADPGATAQELARRAREQAAMANDALYQQGTRAGEYLSRNISEYPLAALLIAGAVGYGLAYLIHTRWQDRVDTEV